MSETGQQAKKFEPVGFFRFRITKLTFLQIDRCAPQQSAGLSAF
jgi:hypothetical protein